MSTLTSSTAILTKTPTRFENADWNYTHNCNDIWIDRGGKVPKQGNIARTLKEQDQFEFTAQYLYNSGMKVKDIAMALGSCELTIRHVLKYLSQEEYQSLHEENENE